MAIDTRNKRSSAVSVGSPWRAMLPEPDGAVGQADRQHVALMYSGISAAEAVPGDGGSLAAATFIRRRIIMG
jgi:hypothetical protein